VCAQFDRRRSHNARAIVFSVTKVVVSVGLIIVLLNQVGLSHIGKTLAATKTGWLTAGLVLGVVAAMLQANQWRGLLSAFGIRRSYWRCLRLDSAARLFDAALPSNIGGDVVRVHLAAGGRSEAAPAALAVALRRLMSLPGLLLLIIVGLLASWHLDYAGRIRAIALVCIAGGVGLGVFLALALRLGLGIPLPGPVDKLRRVLIEASARATHEVHPFGRAAVRGLIFWVVVVLSQTCYIRAVGISVPIEYSLAVVTCVNALSMLPISVGGYGLREGAFSALLGVGGLGTATQGTAVGLCLSAQTLVFGLAGGLVYLSLNRRPAPDQDRVRPHASQRALTLDPS
jgi:uncharacterized membrane protein YbhN (UPF0104 family)